MPPNVEHETVAEAPALKQRGKGKASGATGASTTYARTKKQLVEPLPIAPQEAPFTLADLKRAIPAHCFQPTLHESFFHLALDLVQVALTVAAIMWLDAAYLVRAPVVLRLAVWAAYAFVQGVTMTGLWVIAHECGHGGFSLHTRVNDAVGYVVHTALYVPYFSWQRSHSSHHHYTNNLDKDEVFVPTKMDESASPKPASALMTLVHLTGTLAFGWWMYLLTNATSHATERRANHFEAGCEIFKERDYAWVNLSTVGLAAWTAVLCALGHTYGYGLVTALYLPPLFVTNAFLVAITFMQHTDETLAHFGNDDWSWLRGALCTIDRTMGRVLDVKLHYIHSAHVCHHVFSRIPFYHAEEATRHMIPVLGKFYLRDDSNYLVSLYRTFRDCGYIENGRGPLYFLIDEEAKHH